MKNIYFPIPYRLDEENSHKNFKFHFRLANYPDKDPSDKLVEETAENLFQFLYETCHYKLFDALKKQINDVQDL